jgi:hypothetical protein
MGASESPGSGNDMQAPAGRHPVRHRNDKLVFGIDGLSAETALPLTALFRRRVARFFHVRRTTI